MSRLRTIALSFALSLGLAAAAAAQTAPAVEQPWARATIGNSTVSAAYMILRNPAGQPDRLLEASTPAAGRVELHTMTMDNNVMRMRRVDAIDVAAGGATQLRPGGLHVMLMDLRQPLRAGEQLQLTLRFERAGTVQVAVPVAAANATAAPAHRH
ncbi:MAG: copper chaperone PCu(A)C [Alphaproteobacteria bacterium]|nr:copper chaperone PCu(A)C [Alphaproteobacteria bacterium]